MTRHATYRQTHEPGDAWGCRGYRRLTRRRWLRSTAMFSGSLALTQLGESLALSAEQTSRQPPKSLLMIWLQGGPSQLETFDPHAGTAIGGEVKAISTRIPKIEIAHTLPATAEQLHHACLIRSMISKEGDHERATYYLKTGWRPDPTVEHPAIGSIVCHQSPENLEIPRHISILPGQWPARGGYLGPAFDAFQVGDPAEPIPNLTPAVERSRMQLRNNLLLQTLESEFQRGRLADLDTRRTLHRAMTEQAMSMMDSDQLAAFDVSVEGGETLSRFGDSPFGRGCLAAIRLLSAGVRCVEVELSGWDSHINNHQLQTDRAAILDRALAATLQELAARDLLNDTVLFCGGEFGRTPRINPAAGRDHWPHGFSVLLSGGGFRRGYVHGATADKPDLTKLDGDDRDAPIEWVENPIDVPDLHATLLRALGIDHRDERVTPVGRPLKWSDGSPVQTLLDG